MCSIGVMEMPEDFRYRDVFLKGRPQHDRFDKFRIRHPSMDTEHRAKIFSPFDALKGFKEEIAAKNIRYRDRRELTKEECTELNRRLHILKELTGNRSSAQKICAAVTVIFYSPCTDENSEAFGNGGSYQKISGICRCVDEICGVLLVDTCRIPFEDILCIENEDGFFSTRQDGGIPG